MAEPSDRSRVLSDAVGPTISACLSRSRLSPRSSMLRLVLNSLFLLDLLGEKTRIARLGQAVFRAVYWCLRQYLYGVGDSVEGRIDENGV